MLRMSKLQEYVFVLWGDGFDETTATIFVTELRKAGLRVKVVGLTRQQTSGAYGLALVPDYTLEEALSLTAQTRCLVIPCPLRIAKRLKNDPRLGHFICQIQSHQARFVIGQLNGADPRELGLYSLSLDDVTVYPEGDGLAAFARQIADSLSMRTQT
jgi:hypothetical protein